MITLENSKAIFLKSGTYYIGDVSFLVTQKNTKLVNRKLCLHDNDTVFVNMYCTMMKTAMVIRHRCLYTVPVITNIGVTTLDNVIKNSKFKDDKGLGAEIKLKENSYIVINDYGIKGIYFQIYDIDDNILASIPLNFKRD